MRLPFSTATVGWKSLGVLIAILVLLAALFVFVAIIAVRFIVFLAIVGLVVYAWSKIRTLGGGDLPPDSGARSPRPSPTRVGGGEEEIPGA